MRTSQDDAGTPVPSTPEKRPRLHGDKHTTPDSLKTDYEETVSAIKDEDASWTSETLGSQDTVSDNADDEDTDMREALCARCMTVAKIIFSCLGEKEYSIEERLEAVRFVKERVSAVLIGVRKDHTAQRHVIDEYSDTFDLEE